MAVVLAPRVTERVLGKPVTTPRSAPALGAPHAAASARPFRQILRELGGTIDRGESLVDGALGGGQERLGSGDLIALQAGIYRYSETVDLTVKLVDHATSAVRTTLQNPG